MSKSHLLWVVLGMTAAFSAVAAAPAFAEDEWLWNGAVITGELAANIDGEILLEDMKAPTVLDVLCTYEEMTVILGPFLNVILEILTLSGTPAPLDCQVTNSTACENNLAEVTPVNLGWHWEIDGMLIPPVLWELLKENEEGKVPGYKITCKTIVGTVTDECLGGMTGDLTNESTGVLEVTTGEEEGFNSMTCTLGGEKSGLGEISALITAPGGGTLSVS